MDSAQTKLRRLWQLDDLFHNCQRYPRKRGVPRTDRLASILRHGLVAPGVSDGTVTSDLNILAEGLAEPYDRLVFLHRFGEQSWIYTMNMPGMFTVFVDPALPVITQEDMGENWCVLCRDEVYVRERVPVEKFTALVVHEEDAAGILAEFQPEFERLRLPVYLYGGATLWPEQV